MPYNSIRRPERARQNQTLRHAAVAHLVERHLAKVEVASSSLVARSISFYGRHRRTPSRQWSPCPPLRAILPPLPRFRLAASAAGGASAESSSPAPFHFTGAIGAHRRGNGRLARLCGQFSRRFLDFASLYPPQAALRRNPRRPLHFILRAPSALTVVRSANEKGATACSFSCLVT